MILDTLLGRRSGSPENPANDPHGDEDFFADPGALKPNRETSMTLSAVWKGVSLISNYCAKLPLKVYKRDGENWEVDRDHPAFPLVHTRANPYMTVFSLRRTMTKHAVLDGNGYAAILRDASGRPEELWPLDPVSTYPIQYGLEGDPMVWEYFTTIGGQSFRIPQGDVLHIKGTTDDGIEGLETFVYGRNAIGLEMEAENFGRMFFKRGLQPSGVLSFPKRLKDPAIKNLRKSFERAHSGVSNAFRLVILEDGGKLEQSNVDAEKAQLLETRDFQIRDIANFLGLPPHKLGDVSRQGYASLEQENQSFLDESLDPWLVEWESECEAKLLTEEERTSETQEIKFVRNAVVSTDMAGRFSAYNTALMGGWISRNEVRAREELNPMPGGDTYFIPLNMGLVGEEGLAVPVTGDVITNEGETDNAFEDDDQNGVTEEPPAPAVGEGDAAPEAGDGDDRQALEDLLTWAITRALNRLVMTTSSRYKRAEFGDFLEWLDRDDLREKTWGPVRGVLDPTVRAVRATGYTRADTDSLTSCLIERVRSDFLQMVDTMPEAEFVRAIDNYSANVVDELARQTAQTLMIEETQR